MTGDLGTGNAIVHDAAREVLDFWFALPGERHFSREPELDREIKQRFGELRDEVARTDAADWRGGPDELLAAILLLDQFSRNIYRDSPRAYEADDLAVQLTLLAIDRGWEASYADEEKPFLYMPLMHAEDLPLQNLSVEKFETLGGGNLAFAVGHREVIERFGRYPTRNAVLGRTTTPEEREYLAEPADNGPPKS